MQGELRTVTELPDRIDSTPARDSTVRAAAVAYTPNLARERAIRILNVMVALVGLVLTLPLWLLIAVAVKLTSRGPVFYTQTRVGLDVRGRRPPRHDSRRQQDIGGRPFTIYKFRTMTVGAEREGQAVWAQANDARVTSVGGFLRQCRLDELPQLLNVLKGDMNIVGPRPERPQLFAELREQIPHYPLRQRVPPGITGHAQVHLQYDTSVEDVRAKVAHDLEYIAERSLWKDFVIMLKTIPVMLFRKGGW
jgi:lipopolysaccharide/colanic/teichoic acid biosynthesis glycosyltransferase